MALTLNNTPGSYYSAHGDLIFVVSEPTKSVDPVTYPDYKYVADIYVNGALVTRLKRVPTPDNNRGIFNIGTIVRSYVAAVFNPTANSLRAQQSGANEFFVNVQVKFGEEYNFTLYPDLLIDSARVYFNHYNGRLIEQNTSLAAYADKALTVRPFSTPVNRNDNFCFIPFLPSDTDTVTVSCKSYNESGINIETVSQLVTPVAINTMELFNVSPSVLNDAQPGFIDDSVKYYTVEFQTPNISGDSIFRFDLTCEARYDNHTIHFLNRFGGFESKDFSKVSRKKLSLEKKDFSKMPYTVDSNGVVSYYNSNNVYNETASTYAVQYSEKMTLNSDLLTDAEYIWLSDLIVSPLVYLEENNYFIPVKITATDYEFRKTINDKLTNLAIEIEFGNQLNAQYR